MRNKIAALLITLFSLTEARSAELDANAINSAEFAPRLTIAPFW